MKTKLILLLSLFCNVLLAQISANSQKTLFGFIAAKEYSKDIALYNAKKFVVDEIIEPSDTITQFEIVALVAANSGELTTLAYRCLGKRKSGLIFGFYNNYWNNAGVIYSGYGFKALTKIETFELIQKIQSAIREHANYIQDEHDSNNVCFKYDDMTFIIYRTMTGIIIRVFWNGFSADWKESEFNKTTEMIGK